MSPNRARPTIVLAAGGTGGHVFPALAVADALGALADVEVVFVGSPRGLETRLVPPRGYRLELLEAAPLKGGGAARAVRGAAIAAVATVRALGLVRRLSPHALLSIGGYAAGPVALAAAIQRVPVALLEPNAVLGLANRWLAPMSRRAYVAWNELGARFPKERAKVYGVPLRAGFVPRPYAGQQATARILVLGGSQGAQALNLRMPEALARVRKEAPEVEVVHQTGAGNDAPVRAAYAREGLPRASVVPFLEDIAMEIAAADVIVARAGAVTVAEIAAVGRAAIFVPFPHAADDHQAKNAAALADKGAAVCIRQEAADAVRLALEIVSLLKDRARRVRMAEAARAQGRPSAAHDVAADLLALAGIEASAAPRNGKRATNGQPGTRAGTEAR